MTLTARCWPRRVLAVTALAVLAAACTPGSLESPGASANSSQGCDIDAEPPGREVRVNVGDQMRSALLHTPESVTVDEPSPLVLVFHGFGSSAVGMEVGSGMSEQADDAGFIAVYPQGTGFSPQWDLVGNDDTMFIDELLDRLEAEVCFDLLRVYATGFSMGGGMANIVGCRLAGRIAAIGPVSGIYLPDEAESCTPSRPVPVIAFHGIADAVLPYAGGRAPGPYPEMMGVEAWAADWAERNGCDEEPEPQRAIIETVEPLFWTGCSAPVELYPIANRGHTWPGSPLDASPETANDVSAANLIWDFFARYTLTEP